MVLTGKVKSGKKKRKRGRLTHFETQLELAKISWAPVLECLSLLDSKKYSKIEDLPLNEEPFHINLGKQLIESEKKNELKEIKWITGRQIKKIHDDLILTFGGELGIADESQLDAIVDRAKNSRIFGRDVFETVIHKAAFFMHSLLRYHQFADGQKRTGISTAFIFLGLNGYTMWSRNVLEEIHFCIETAQGEHEVEEITQWLADRILDHNSLAAEGRQNILTSVINNRHIKVQCSKCHSYISPNSFRVTCVRCGRQYELTLSGIVLTQGITPRIEYNVGLHKLEDSNLVKDGVISLNSP
jgi:death-on-curing protein